MRIAITGITGLIGSAAAASLRADGHDVVGVSRRPGPDTVTWDLDAGTLDGAALEGTDAVIHLAGESIGGRWTAAKRSRILESRTRSTAVLADAIAALDTPPAVFCSGSAVGGYGDRGDEVVDEASDTRTDTFLGEVVAAWEAAAAPASAAGVRVVHPRVGLVLASEADAFVKLVRATKLLAGGPMGSGRQYVSWVSLGDTVRALRFMVDHDLEGPVNVTAPGPVRQRDFAKALGRALRRPALTPAPGFALKLILGAMGEELLLHGVNAVPRALTDAGFTFDDDDLDALLARLV